MTGDEKFNESLIQFAKIASGVIILAATFKLSYLIDKKPLRIASYVLGYAGSGFLIYNGISNFPKLNTPT